MGNKINKLKMNSKSKESSDNNDEDTTKTKDKSKKPASRFVTKNRTCILVLLLALLVILVNIKTVLNSNKKLIENLQDERLDTIEYRKEAEEKFENNLNLNLNVKFFNNEISAKPNKETLNEILENWNDDFEELELNHSYIQWLFPIHSQGMNQQSHSLQLHEYLRLRANENTKTILLKSFKMMLRFYGAKLVQEEANNVVIKRRKEFKKSYSNLKQRTHNYLRISRILQCLGDFDLETYQIAWLKYFLNEIFKERKLFELADSFTRYWIHTIKNDQKRMLLIQEVEATINELEDDL